MSEKTTVIPDGMMLISKLEYEGLLTEIESLKRTVEIAKEKADPTTNLAVHNVTKSISALCKAPDSFYLIELGVGTMPMKLVEKLCKTLRDGLVESGLADRFVIVPSAKHRPIHIKCTELCNNCPYKPADRAWQTIISDELQNLTQAEKPARVG